jgi:hypothetical protein
MRMLVSDVYPKLSRKRGAIEKAIYYYSSSARHANIPCQCRLVGALSLLVRCVFLLSPPSAWAERPPASMARAAGPGSFARPA